MLTTRPFLPIACHAEPVYLGCARRERTTIWCCIRRADFPVRRTFATQGDGANTRGCNHANAASYRSYSGSRVVDGAWHCLAPQRLHLPAAGHPADGSLPVGSTAPTVTRPMGARGPALPVRVGGLGDGGGSGCLSRLLAGQELASGRVLGAIFMVPLRHGGSARCRLRSAEFPSRPAPL